MQSLQNVSWEGHWFFRYKIYHIPFWALYHFLWGVAEFSLVEVLSMIFYTPRYMIFASYVLLHTLAVYINLYYLLPRLLAKSKLGLYIFYLVLLIIGTSISLIYSYYGVAFLTGKSMEYFCGFEDNQNDLIGFFFRQALPSTAGAMLLGLSIKLAKNWSQAQKRQQLLEKEKLETELKFLKYQFNPHFLFNTINSIFFLIHKDPKMASNALVEFSELLRYQLYECNEKQIPLHQEVAYLENFIALEKLRHNQDLSLETQLELGEHAAYQIAPFILMTFVENAFKHVSRHNQGGNWIRIRLDVPEANTLMLEIENSSCPENASGQEAVHYGGIGLKNVQRRLDLLYPGAHQLDIEKGEDRFKIRLCLGLAPPLPSSVSHTQTSILSNA